MRSEAKTTTWQQIGLDLEAGANVYYIVARVVLMEASCLDGSYCVFKVVLHRLRRSCRGGSSSSLFG